MYTLQDCKKRTGICCRPSAWRLSSETFNSHELATTQSAFTELRTFLFPEFTVLVYVTCRTAQPSKVQSTSSDVTTAKPTHVPTDSGLKSMATCLIVGHLCSRSHKACSCCDDSPQPENLYTHTHGATRKQHQRKLSHKIAQATHRNVVTAEQAGRANVNAAKVPASRAHPVRENASEGPSVRKALRASGSGFSSDFAAAFPPF
jgi:hypothetical protein